MTLQNLNLLWPEIIMLIGACLCLFLGLSRRPSLRRLTSWITALTMLVAATAVRFPFTSIAREMLDESSMPQYIKWWTLMIGLLLWTLADGLPGRLVQNAMDDLSPGAWFNPSKSNRGEFFSFFLFSLTGVMLCAGANDLAWLFLALELTSLPTYVMVATMRDKLPALESGVKYFFLGALAAAVFLYGFALIYGATGTTNLHDIRQAVLTMPESQQPMFHLGVVLAVLGISYKIAAFPMYFYTADVYQGAATPVTAFLSFVPKTAGFVSLILILNLVGWPLPPSIQGLLWIMAVITMTAGNVLGLLQNNVKRVLAYSSVAHSGYMLIGLAAGPVLVKAVAGEEAVGSAMGNGLAAILFYLVSYGLANFAAFAVLACLERNDDEAQTFDDLAGLYHRNPKLAVIMLLAVLSLLGIPPMIGFLGKVYLFEAAINTGQSYMVLLVVIAVINSAISGVYYLRIASACFFDPPQATIRMTAGPLRITGAAVAAVAAITYGLVGYNLVDSASKATSNLSVMVSMNQPKPAQTELADAKLPAQPDAGELHNGQTIR